MHLTSKQIAMLSWMRAQHRSGVAWARPPDMRAGWALVRKGLLEVPDEGPRGRHMRVTISGYALNLERNP